MLKRVSRENGEWDELMRQWESECEQFSENIDDYASASLPVLGDLAIEAQKLSAGVYAFPDDTNGGYLAACQVNSAFLPGYKGKVLRTRHIVFSPKFDFDEDLDLETYVETLVGVFTGVIVLSYTEMPSEHVKFHLKSPAERTFGANFTEALKDHSAFKKVNMVASWIYLSKA